RRSQKKLNIIKKAIRVYNATPQGDQGESGWSLDELVTDENTLSPELVLAGSDDLHQVLTLLDKLDPRDAAGLRVRFRLDGEGPKTLKENRQPPRPPRRPGPPDRPA